MVSTEPAARLQAIGIEESVIANILKNKAVTAKFMEVLDLSGLQDAPKAKGALLYAVATKVKPLIQAHLKLVVDQVVNDKWTRTTQLDEGIKYLEQKVKKAGSDKQVEIDQADLDKSTGVGVVITEQMIEEAIDKLIKDNAKAIDEQKHDFKFATFRNKIKDVNDDFKWADGGVIGQVIDKKKLALLGEPPAREEGKKKPKAPKEEKPKAEEKKEEVVEEVKTINIKDLIGRDVNAGNTAEQLKRHNDFTGGRVMTRFPPEPNGYLHIGHAKSIRFNFTVAKEYQGDTYLRFDDTNPCKERDEFINHIKEIVGWLGFKPWKTTASSLYFQQLYEHAVKLIKKGLAFVCFQNAAEMSRCRNEMIESPWRNASIEENLKNFDRMKSGYYNEGECCLRAKMDMKSTNTVMRDLVMYRIRYVAHPHSGNDWCIYPTYDFTHGMVDSMENITHSLCTLEFEVRRECYYWFLEHCDMYKPMVWEFGRLNMSNTVLSKRKIERLINDNFVTGWDDPRLHTIQGLRRRGYTSTIINKFCEEIGVTRNSNETLTSYKLLEFHAR
jgi:glutaminyl-tRNA synthetase